MHSFLWLTKFVLWNLANKMVMLLSNVPLLQTSEHRRNPLMYLPVVRSVLNELPQTQSREGHRRTGIYAWEQVTQEQKLTDWGSLPASSLSPSTVQVADPCHSCTRIFSMLQPQPGFTQGPQRHLQLPRFPSSFPPTLISESGGSKQEMQSLLRRQYALPCLQGICIKI